MKAILFFFIITICRLIMITSQLSLLNKYGKKITQKEIIVLTYAGLRGAIALCLSLMVAKNYIYE